MGTYVCGCVFIYRSTLRKDIPIFNEKILNLIVEDRKEFKMNMPAYVVKIKVQVSAKVMRY